MNILHSNSRSKPIGQCKRVLWAAAAAAATLLGTAATRSANAANIILTNGNSQVTINPTSSAGLEDWTINGTNQMNQEWFWYRTGSAVGQSSIDGLGLTSSTELDTTGDSLNDTAILDYGSSSGLNIALTYSLSGGLSGSETSDLGETIAINNGTKSTQTYHFFEYTNFNLGNSKSGQTVSITGGNTATVQGNGMDAQTVVSPAPSEFEANDYPNLLNHVNAASSYQLSDVTTAAAGNPEWGFEWDVTLNAGSSYVISVDKNIKAESVVTVPEPATGSIALLGFGSALLWRPRRRDDEPDSGTVQVAEA